MSNKPYAVPLHEQLASVPRDARLIIDDANGMGTRFIPVGRYCHEAANVLRVLVKHSQRKWRELTEEDALDLLPVMESEYEVDVEMILEFAKAIETKLKEKNHG